MSQMNPRLPVKTKAARQLHCKVSQTTIGGANTAPILVPALKMPVASARSFSGNHSATLLIEAGKFPASPAPKKNRATPNDNALLASACAIGQSTTRRRKWRTPGECPASQSPCQRQSSFRHRPARKRRQSSRSRFPTNAAPIGGVASGRRGFAGQCSYSSRRKAAAHRSTSASERGGAAVRGFWGNMKKIAPWMGTPQIPRASLIMRLDQRQNVPALLQHGNLGIATDQCERPLQGLLGRLGRLKANMSLDFLRDVLRHHKASGAIPNHPPDVSQVRRRYQIRDPLFGH